MAAVTGDGQTEGSAGQQGLILSCPFAAADRSGPTKPTRSGFDEQIVLTLSPPFRPNGFVDVPATR